MTIPSIFEFSSNNYLTSYLTYAAFQEDSLQSPTKKLTTRALWGSTTGELLNFYTSSLQAAASKQYYYEVWSSASVECDIQDIKMFSITYGNFNGSGSSLISGGQAGDTPSRAIYGQYRSLCLESNPLTGSAAGAPTTFTLANGKEVTQFYAINFNRERIGDKLDPGNFELNLAELNGGAHANSVYTGSNVAVSASNKVITLIDDSRDSTDSLGYLGMPSPVRNLVSGSITNGIYNASAPHYYGLVYVDQAAILIDADKLNQSASFNTVTSSNANGDNSFKLFTSISGSGTFGTGNGFFARSVDIKECSYYYIRVYPSSFNYTNNPTYVTSSGDFYNKIENTAFLAGEPNVYITSVGLYNDQHELMAIAKMSKPVLKNYNEEVSITVKLEY